MKPLSLAIVSLLAGCSAQPTTEAPAATSPNSAAKSAPFSPAPAQAVAVSGPFAPTDGCASEKGARAFRTAFEAAVKARDASALAALAINDVKLDFGGGAGVDQLRHRLAGAEGGKLWQSLAEVIALGCAIQQGNLVMPAHFVRDPGKFDPFMAMLVTGQAIPLFTDASAASEKLASISWDAVELVGGLKPAAGFQHVRTAGGKTGYIETAHLRSWLDYRVFARRQPDGQWKIDAIVRGD